MKLKIISDGNYHRTKVVCAETGAVIKGIKSVHIFIDPKRPVRALIEVLKPEVDVVSMESHIE